MKEVVGAPADLSSYLAANQMMQATVGSIAPLVYSWSFSAGICDDKSTLRKYLKDATDDSVRNASYKSTRDFPPKAGVGNGLYVAGDPFVSHSYGNQLIILKMKPGPLAVLQAHRGLGEEKTLTAVQSPALGVMYNWQVGPFTNWAVAYRKGADTAAYDADNAVCVDFREGKPFKDLDLTPLAADADALAFLKRFGFFAPMLNFVGERKPITDGHVRPLVGAEISSAPSSLRELFKGIDPELLKTLRCMKEQSDAIGKCLRELSLLFTENEISGRGEFEGRAGLVALKQLGYVPKDFSNDELGALIAEDQAQWLKDARNKTAFEFVKSQWSLHAERVFGSNRLDDLEIDTNNIPAVADGSEMTTITGGDLFDSPNGKRVGKARSDQLVKKLSTKGGWHQVKFRAWGETTDQQGWMRAHALHPGRLANGGD